MAGKVRFSDKVRQAADDMERMAEASSKVSASGGGNITYVIQSGGKSGNSGSGGGGSNSRVGLDELTRALNYFGISGARASGIRSNDSLIAQLIEQFRREMERLLSQRSVGLDIRKGGLS